MTAPGTDGAPRAWLLLAWLFWSLTPASEAAKPVYPWLEGAASRTLAGAVAPPEGYERVSVAPDSYEEWLRFLPLKPEGALVHLYNGELKSNQAAAVAVLDLDVGREDLQQCADSVMRLRAEYLYSRGRQDDIAFHWTNGDRVPFSRWAAGNRPKVTGSRVLWSKTRAPDASHASLRAYLDEVFRYAGTHSLSQELVPVEDASRMRIGDVFIQGGFPGHAIVVVDLARRGDHTSFLLAQGYMPAQEMHLLRNPLGDGPWYDLDFGDTLPTPEWVFSARDLKRFPEP